MKKSALTIVCSLALTGAALADGTVFWDSITPTAMTAQTNTTQFAFGFGPTGIPGTIGNITSAAGGPTFYFELLYNTNFTGSQVTAPTFSQLFGGSWLDTGLTATNSNIPGRLTTVNPGATAPVSWDNGTTNNIMLVGWSANLGTLWTTVSNELATGSVADILTSEAFFGESATGYLSPNSSPAPGATVFGTSATANGLPINSLNTQLYLILPPIPEPGTIALAGLGGFSLLWFRRRPRP